MNNDRKPIRVTRCKTGEQVVFPSLGYAAHVLPLDKSQISYAAHRGVRIGGRKLGEWLEFEYLEVQDGKTA